MVVASGAGVPVVRVRRRALFAVQVGVDCHPLAGLELIDQGVRAGPVALRVPPEGGEWSGQGWAGLFVCQGRFELFEIDEDLATRRARYARLERRTECGQQMRATKNARQGGDSILNNSAICAKGDKAATGLVI